MKFLSAIVLMFASIATVNAKNLTYDEFKESCQDPALYGHQVPPTQIRLVCKNVFTGWQAIESGSVALDESRLIAGELFSDKHNVSRNSWELATPERNVSCPRYREVVSTAEIEVALTCSQIVDDERGVDDLCEDYLDEAISENPDIVDTEATGNIYSVCGDVIQKP